MRGTKYFERNMISLLRMTLYTVAPLLFGLSAGIASAQSLPIQSLPNEVDLKAAYCSGVIDGAINFVSASIEKTGNEKHDADVKKSMDNNQAQLLDGQKRVRVYLLPRIPFIETSSLATARSSGESDWRSSLSEINACMSTCEKVACMADCRARSRATQRTSICFELSFLPF